MSVETLIAEAESRTNNFVSAAESALATAVQLVQEVGYTGVAFDPPPAPPAPTLDDPLTPPTLDNIDLNLPSEPTTELVFQDVSPIETGEIPTFTVSTPVLDIPTAPAALAAFQASLPAITTDFVFPEPPSQLTNPLIGEVPTFADRDAPVKPTVTLPAFEGVLPTDIPAAPTDLRAEFERSYAQQAPAMIAIVEGYVDQMLAKHSPNYHAGMARLEAQLSTYLDGGTALSPSVETAIYERTRGKQDAETRRVMDVAYKDAASRGHTLPDGAVQSAVMQARQGGADNNAAAARDIAIKQAEMEQQNLQFAVTAIKDLRVSLLQAALSYQQNVITLNGQAVDFAKTVVQSIIELFNSAVRLYEAKLEGYKAEAAALETKLQVQLAQVQLYREEIAAEEALTNIDRNKVEVYKARIDAINVLAAVYRSQIEAVQGRASLEKLKLDLFQGQVQAFTAEVQQKSSEVEVFRARMQGNEALVSLYDAQVRAHGERVTTFRTLIEAKAETVRAAATTNQARSENFRAVWSAYQTTVQARGDVARTKLENQREKVVAFQAQAQATTSRAQVQAEFYRATGDIAVKNAQLSIEAIVRTAENQRAYGESLSKLFTANATVHGTLAASAMSSMTTLSAETLTS